MKLTLEEKQQILAEYNDRSNKAADVRAKWHLSSRDFTVLIHEMGGQMRCPAACGPKGKKEKHIKTCPECRKKVDLKGAKYCPYCGADIRSEKEKLLERAQALYEMCRYLPSAEADRAHGLIKELFEYITR